jgi:hypothetical protein
LRASKDARPGWWPSILRDARTALLRMTDQRVYVSAKNGAVSWLPHTLEKPVRNDHAELTAQSAPPIVFSTVPFGDQKGMRCGRELKAVAVPATVNGEPFVNLPLGEKPGKAATGDDP